MANTRVKSKNLFNFRPQGFIDEDILAFDEKMKTEHNLDLEEMTKTMEKQTEEEFVGGMRGFIDHYMGSSAFSTDAAYVEVNCKQIKLIIKSLCKFALPGLRLLRPLRTKGADQP